MVKELDPCVMFDTALIAISFGWLVEEERARMAYFSRVKGELGRGEEIKVSAPYRQRFTALKLHTTTKFCIFHFYVPKPCFLLYQRDPGNL